MGAPYSLDLSIRVVAGVTDGMSCLEAAEHYQVSHSLVIRWTKRRERMAEKPDITIVTESQQPEWAG